MSATSISHFYDYVPIADASPCFPSTRRGLSENCNCVTSVGHTYLTAIILSRLSSAEVE